MSKKLVRLTEGDLHRIIKESVNKVLNEVWDIDDKGIVDYDEYGRAKNRSYADMEGLDPKLPSDTKRHLMNTPHRDARAETNYQHRFSEPNEFSDDTRKTIRPSGWFVRGSDGWYSDEFKDFDRQSSKLPKMNKAFDTADKRPLHRKGSLNREL